MQSGIENEIPVLVKSPGEYQVAEMVPLIKRIRGFLEARHDDTTYSFTALDFHALVRQFGFTERWSGRPEVILADDVAVELGHPCTSSQAIILTTFKPEYIYHRRVAVVGPDLDEMERGVRYPFTQVVLLAIDPGLTPDLFELDNSQYLMHRLPGYMVRSIPGKLWVRISNAGLCRGLTLKIVGAALINAYSREYKGVTKVESLFVTSILKDAQVLEQVAIVANILAGRHKKLALNNIGEVECVELNCGSCKEKLVCDNLIDIVINRRVKRT